MGHPVDLKIEEEIKEENEDKERLDEMEILKPSNHNAKEQDKRIKEEVKERNETKKETTKNKKVQDKANQKLQENKKELRSQSKDSPGFHCFPFKIPKDLNRIPKITTRSRMAQNLRAQEIEEARQFLRLVCEEGEARQILEVAQMDKAKNHKSRKMILIFRNCLEPEFVGLT